MDLYQILKYRLLLESSKYVNTEKLKVNSRKYKCKVQGCTRMGYAGGFCNTHYLRFRKGKNLSLPIQNRKKDRLCRVCGCEINSKGGWELCANHYKSLRIRIIKETIVEYFKSKCNMCKQSFSIECYDLHHIEQNNKEYSISTMLNCSSLEKIANEVLKCELLCSNCHRIKHHGDNIS